MPDQKTAARTGGRANHGAFRTMTKVSDQPSCYGARDNADIAIVVRARIVAIERTVEL
ncbi:hypothetical protein [Paraburkholderia sp. J67]|uniref:hypothetical protein n=1 Tax=Paraburkholderia sp. J67 TaxID=2805435 RepID=UPI0039F4F6E3